MRKEHTGIPAFGRTSDHRAFVFPRYLITALHLLVLIAAFFLVNACGRRGDPVAVAPSREIGVVFNVRAEEKPGAVRLVWELPKRKDSSPKEIKDFIIFRAEVPVGSAPGDCATCEFRTIDFISPDNEPQQSLFQRLWNRLGRQPSDDGRMYEYIDTQVRKGVSYAYKIVIMDRKNRMGKSSDLAFVYRTQTVPKKNGETLPGAPAGLVALSTPEGVVLTWDEISDQAVSFYRIYRSEGEDFSVIGESFTPAFSDTTVVPSRKYYYRISAVSDVEGGLSDTLEVVTEPR